MIAQKLKSKTNNIKICEEKNNLKIMVEKKDKIMTNS